MSSSRAANDGSGDGDAPQPPSNGRCDGDDCCRAQQKQGEERCDTNTIEKPFDFHSITSRRCNGSDALDDVERGPKCAEHVVIQFQGSNCPSCTSKISKAFESMPAVYNLQMNTILLQAEFDLDLAKSSVRNVIDFVKSSTGRAGQRIGDGWQELDVVVSGTCANFEADAMLPIGVKDVTRLSRYTFSVKYDAEMLGARQLLKALNTKSGVPVSLAPPKSHDEMSTEVRTTAYITAISSILTIPILVLAWAPLPKHTIAYGAVSLALATVIQIVVAGPFYPRAFRSLIIDRVIDLDLLVVLSTSITYGFSVASFICEVNGKRLISGIYFETSALLITLIMVGRLMSDFACHRAVRAGSIRSLQTRFALLVDSADPSGGKGRNVDVRLLEIGDAIRIEPNSSVATDGIIISGVSEFDESVLNGEATLVGKSSGSSVIAGSVNRGDAVLVQVTRLPGDNTIDDIAEMVEEVTHSKTKAQQTADEVARWIVPASATLSILTLIVWSTVNTWGRGEPFGSAILNAIPYAISVLVVCCPCAVAFAVPMVLVIASRVGAKHGVIFRSAQAMNVARRVTHVVFDKTGTLTQDCLSVVSSDYYSKTQSLSAALVLALTRHSNHPVSSAVSKHLQAARVEPVNVTKIRSAVGKGIQGTYNGQTVRVGNARWLRVENLAPVQSLLSQDLTVLCATQGDRLIAVFGLQASLREDASTVVANLAERGIAVSIMSGDEVGAVHSVATKLGISHEFVRARCTPRDKQQHVKKLMQGGNNTVIFCGDGVNDAAALSQASLGAHMNVGSSTEWTAGDAVIIRPSLLGILVLIDLSRDSCRQIIFNFFWAAAYNLFAILFAAGAFVHIHLPPQYAGLGEAVSVLPVILVPLQLRWRKYL